MSRTGITLRLITLKGWVDQLSGKVKTNKPKRKKMYPKR